MKMTKAIITAVAMLLLIAFFILGRENNKAIVVYKSDLEKYNLGDEKGAIPDWEKAIELNPAYKSQLQPLLDEARKKIK